MTSNACVISSNPSTPPSSQTDIVVYDEIHNSPLHSELAAYVYPAEIVYATVEVKGTLRRGDLKKIIGDLMKGRAMAEHRWYVKYVSEPKDPSRPNELVVKPEEFTVPKPAARSFVFAFSQDGWETVEALAESLRAVSDQRQRICMD